MSSEPACPLAEALMGSICPLHDDSFPVLLPLSPWNLISLHLFVMLGIKLTEYYVAWTVSTVCNRRPEVVLWL